MRKFKSLINPTESMRKSMFKEMYDQGFYFQSFNKIHDDEKLINENIIKVDEELWIFENREFINELETYQNKTFVQLTKETGYSINKIKRIINEL